MSTTQRFESINALFL